MTSRSDAATKTSRRPSAGLIDSVLARARIKTNVCTRQRRQNGYTLQRREVTDYNLIYVLRGGAVWAIGSEDMPLRPNDLLIVPPHVSHRGYSTTRRVDLLSVHVEATLPGGQDVFGLLRPPPVRRVISGGALERYLDAFGLEFTNKNDTFPPSARPLQEGWGRLIALQLLREDAELGLLEPTELNPLITETMRYLAERIAEPITLDELCRHTGYSAQHLSRLFRRALGVTPLQHLATLRIDRARDLLAEDTLTVQAIAERVGFTDPFYFSRVFHDQAGMSPSAYRREICSDHPA